MNGIIVIIHIRLYSQNPNFPSRELLSFIYMLCIFPNRDPRLKILFQKRHLRELNAVLSFSTLVFRNSKTNNIFKI